MNITIKHNNTEISLKVKDFYSGNPTDEEVIRVAEKFIQFSKKLIKEIDEISNKAK